MYQIIKSIAIGCCIMLLLINTYAQPTLNRVEYYIDADPGYGNATTVSISALQSNLPNLTVNINPASITAGVHVLGIRARDSDGAWSLDNKWLFVKDSTAGSSPAIANAEYYIDTDPGYGNANSISFSNGTNLTDLPVNINYGGLNNGVHVFGIRAKDVSGAWSLDNKWLFVKDALPKAVPDIVRVEYYIDTDPGYGNAFKADSITQSANLVNIMQQVKIGTLSDGSHIIGIRALDSDGAWSLDNKLLFIINGGPLPIIISNFSGIHINNYNELTVQIQQALNVKEIQLQRSADGNNFTYLGTVASGAVTASTYKFNDKNALKGNNFYRLRIVDNDGKVTYSTVVLLSNTSGFVIQAFPNPVSDNLVIHFQNTQAGYYNVKVTDVSGKLFYLKKINISQQGQNGEMNISFKNCSKGSYFLQVNDAFNKTVTTQTIIKN